MVAPAKIVVEKEDVGVIKSENQNYASVFFIRIWKEVKLNKNDFEIFNVRKTGDGFPKKICNICHKLKNTKEFAKNQNAKNNRSVRRPSCKNCRKQLEGDGVPRSKKLNGLKNKPKMNLLNVRSVLKEPLLV